MVPVAGRYVEGSATSRAYCGPPSMIAAVRPAVREPPDVRSGQGDLAVGGGDGEFGERAGCRPAYHGAVHDRVLAAVARADDQARVHRPDDAALVGTGGGECLELARGGLGDHHVLGFEDLAAADRDRRGGTEV